MDHPQHSNAMDRRSWLVGSAAASFAACSKPALREWKPVGIYRAPEYSESLYDLVRRIISDHKLDVRGKRVVLKPNLVEFDERTTVNTHPKLVHAAAEAFRAAGAADVRIAEGPGHRRITLDLADAAGYFSTVKNFENVFTDLNLDEVTRVELKTPHSKLSSLYLPNTIVSCDLLVSLPKLKTHHWAGATLSMKNFFGIVPGGVYGWPKNVLHWAGIHESIADIYRLVPETFAIVDGVIGMEGNGPIQGIPKSAGVIVAGTSLPAVDATCCRIMDLNPRKIGYLQLTASEENYSEERIQQIGERIDSVATKFAVLPDLEFLRLSSQPTKS